MLRYLNTIFHILLYLNVNEISSLTQASTPTKVAVTGVTGRLGREVVMQLSSKNIPVRCLLRHAIDSTNSDDERPNAIDDDSSSLEVASYLSSLNGVEMVKGDVTDKVSIDRLVEGCTALISVHGPPKPKNVLTSLIPFLSSEEDVTHSKMINYVGIQNIIDATSNNDNNTVKRIVRITGKNETPFSIFSVLINMFGKMAKGWNYEGEQLLRKKSTVPYTIIRPGVMRSSDVPTGKVRALLDNGQDLKVSAVSYQQIAELCIESLNYENAARSTLVAMNVDDDEGEETYGPLLAKVKGDSREYPETLIDKHKQGARIGSAALTLFAVIFINAVISLLSKVLSLFF